MAYKMTRYLVQVQPELLRPAELQRLQLSFQAVPSLRLEPQPVFDYLVVDLLPGQERQVLGIRGVARLVPDKRLSIFALPVNLELQLAANPFKLINAALPRQEVWSTGESRKTVGADVAEAAGITGVEVKVAVTDTGTDPTHPQLLGQQGESYVAGQPYVLDENGHGTHVASTIAGSQVPHPLGLIRGVAPGVSLIHIKVLGYGLGAGSMSDILKGMQRAAELGAKILSMSLGGDDTTDAESPEFRAVRQLTERGILVVIAAGNSGPGSQTLGSPGSAPDAITVGAINRQGALADFSSRGPSKLGLTKPDCVAPGVDILSGSTGFIAAYRFVDGLRFAAISGTSMATPHASGVLALAEELARRRGGTLTTSAVKAAMARSGLAKDNERGWGLISYQLLRRYIEG